MRRLRAPDLLIVVGFYVALTILFAYPISVRPGEVLFGDNPDTHLFIWTLAWDAHAFLHQPFSLFDSNIYYPYPRTLAFSENLLGLALFSAPLQWWTRNPILAMNVASLAGATLCAVGAYVLAWRLGLSSRAAVVCGLVFGFSPARFLRTGQLHVGAVQWIPFTLASLHAYLDDGNKRHLRLAIAFFSLQAVTSGHGAVFLTLAVAIFVGYRVLLGEPLALRRRLLDIGLPGVLLLAPAVLVYLPYRRVAHEMGFKRFFQPWEPNAESFLTTRTHVQAWLMSWSPWPNAIDTASAYLFPGILPLLLAAVALIAAVTRRGQDHSAVASAPARTRRWQWATALVLELGALASVAVGVLVAVGGAVRWHLGNIEVFSARPGPRPWIWAAMMVGLRLGLRRSAPFSPRARIAQSRDLWRRWSERATFWRRDPTMLYGLLTLVNVWILIGPPWGIWPQAFLLPGFNLIRAPGRFIVLAVLGIAVLAAIGFDWLAKRLKPRGQNWLAAATIGIMIVEFSGMPLPAFDLNVPMPAADRWLAIQPGPFVVAEFPVVDSARYQTTYMLHSMAHWQKTIHGYSGYEAEMHTLLYRELRGFPDELSLRRLRELGVRFAIVHADLYPPGEWPDAEERLRQFKPQLKLEYEAGTGRVYSLLPQP